MATSMGRHTQPWTLLYRGVHRPRATAGRDRSRVLGPPIASAEASTLHQSRRHRAGYVVLDAAGARRPPDRRPGPPEWPINPRYQALYGRLQGLIIQDRRC